MANGMRDANEQGFGAVAMYYVGFALYASVPAFYTIALANMDAFVLVFSGLASCALTLSVCVSHRCGSFVYRNAAKTGTTILLCCCALTPLALFASDNFAGMAGLSAQAVMGVCAGMSFALLLLLWHTICCRLLKTNDGARLSFIVLEALLLAAVFIALSAAFSRVLAPALCSAALLGSTVLNRIELRITSCDGISDVESDGENGNPRMPNQHAGYPVLVGALCGLMGFFALGALSAAMVVIVIGIGALLTYVSAIVVTHKLKRSWSFYTAERIAFPIAFSSVLLAPLIYYNAVAAGIALFLCIAGTSLFFGAHVMLMMRWLYRWNCQPIRHFAHGTLTIASGITVGFLIWSALSLSGDYRPQLSGVAFIALMLALVIMNAVSPYGSLEKFNTIANRKANVVPSKGKGVWETAVEAIAQDFKLTPRETEVAMLLAHGRNTKHISETLVIAEHTTKTHISHIYKKVGVSNQQAFIDLVETEVNEIREVVS